MKNPRKTIAATEIKNRFGDYLGEVVRRREPLLIERRGKPVAVIVDFECWKTLKPESGLNNEHPWAAAARKLANDIRREKPGLKPFSAVDTIRQIREEE
jgi:prevent-host-death family protein